MGHPAILGHEILGHEILGNVMGPIVRHAAIRRIRMRPQRRRPKHPKPRLKTVQIAHGAAVRVVRLPPVMRRVVTSTVISRLMPIACHRH